MHGTPFPTPGQPQPVMVRPAPPPVTRLKRVLLLTLVGGVLLLLVYGMIAGFTPRAKKTREAEALNRYGAQTSPITTLSTGYPQLPHRAVTPPPPDTPQPATAPAPAQPVQHPSGPAQAPKPPRKIEMLMVRNDTREGPQAPPVPVTPQLAALPESHAAGQTAFVEHASALQPTQVQETLHPMPSPYTIMAGTVIPMALLTGINSELPGRLTARTTVPVTDMVHGVVLIPQNTLVVGVYNADIIYGQDRVLVVWQRLVFPNGDSMQLEGMEGADLSGYAGLKDTVDYHLWPLFRAVLLSSILSVGSRVPAGNTTGYQQNLPQEFSQDFGQNANQAGQAIVNRELRRQPTIDIRPGMAGVIMVHRDLVLAPWQEGRRAR